MVIISSLIEEAKRPPAKSNDPMRTTRKTKVSGNWA
jgi:hypothetical protein